MTRKKPGGYSNKLRLRRIRSRFSTFSPQTNLQIFQLRSQTNKNQPLDVPAEGPEEPKEPYQPLDVPTEGPEEPEEPNNPNPLPENPPVPMANNQLNWSYFKSDFSGKPEEDVEAHLLRTSDWMTTHDFPEPKGKEILFNSFRRS